MALTTADGFRRDFKQDRKTELQKEFAALRVLIVEDSAFIRKIVRGLLAGMGIHKVAEATDGFAALQALQSFQPGIVLLDLEMPNLNGLQFIRRLQARSNFAALASRILVLTAHADRDRVIYVKDNGIGGFLAKPMSANRLRGHIVAILNKLQMTEVALVPAPSEESNSFVLLD